MSILGRINRVIKSNVNELMDKMTDPAKEVELLIVEMEQGLKQAREEVVKATADAKRAEMKADELARDADRWQQRAEAAVRAGDDDLARQALVQKLEADRSLEEGQRVVAQQRAYVDELKESLKQLDARLRDVKLRKESIKQRAKAAKEGRSGLAGGEAFSRFDQLEGRIEAMEEMQEISADLDQRSAATEAKFARLEGTSRNPKIDDDLAALKRKLEGGNGSPEVAAVEALRARLSDLVLVEPEGLVAGLDPVEAEALQVAFVADLRGTLAAADSLMATLTDAPPPTSVASRGDAASRWALASRLERVAARVAARLEALTPSDSPA